MLWNPSYLGAALIARFDASDSANYTLTTAKVSAWTNLAPAGGSAVQATAGSRPVIAAAALGGLDVVRFDGTDDVLSQTTVAIPRHTRLHFFVAGDWDDATAQAAAGSVSRVFTTALETYTSSAVVSAASVTLYLGDGGGSTFADCDIGEILMAVDLTDAEIAECEGYLAWKWGLEASLDPAHAYADRPPTIAVALPDAPWPIDMNTRLLDFGQDVNAIRGAAQRIASPGQRHALDLALPAMSRACAGEWMAARKRARAQGRPVRYTIPARSGQLSLGTVLVDGASQTGEFLAVKGLNAAPEVGRGFSVFAEGGIEYHEVVGEVTVTSGYARLPISPPLRGSPEDAAALNFAGPEFEGMIEGNEEGVTITRLTFFKTGLTIIEDE